MWCTYTKIFVFRDCLDEEMIDVNVKEFALSKE